MQLANFVAALAAVTVGAVTARGSHDPWGENVQPNLHTDYLHQFSGRPLGDAIVT